MVRDRDDVSLLVEIADRSVRSGATQGSTGQQETLRVVHQSLSVESGWADAVKDGLDEAAVVTGPTHQSCVPG